MRTRVLVACAIVGLLLVGRSLLAGDDYELELVMPSADAAFKGGQVLINGVPVGNVRSIGVRDGQAVVTVRIDDAHAPLPAGTKARIKWLSVVGARVVELLPGSEENPDLASGTMITNAVEPVELDQVLAALDAPTRQKLRGLVAQLDKTVKGREQATNDTLSTIGPTFDSLGEILRAVGQDGPAIRELVTELHQVTGSLAARHNDISGTVSDLDTLTRAVAADQAALSAGLAKLPGSLGQATDTLSKVKPAVGKTRGLLQDLEPAAARLPSVAANLSPVLQALRPAVADLRTTLGAASTLLGTTPALLDTAHATLPDINNVVGQSAPIVDFLRPYTPELAGWLSNWTSIFASQNRGGNYARALITASASSPGIYSGGVPVGMQRADTPAPGSIAGQPWTDANGDDIR